MKKLIIMLFVALTTVSGRAAEASDTVAVITGATDVTVSRCAGAVTVDVAGSDTNKSYVYTVMADTTLSDPWNIDLPFLHKKQRKFATAFLKTVYIGFAIPDNAPHGLRQSVDFGVPDIFAFSWRPSYNTSFSVGAGLMGFKVNLGGGFHFGNSGNVLTVEENTTDMRDVSSSLLKYSISVPLRYQQRIYRGLGFSLAAIAKINTYASAETRWKSGGMSNKVTITGLEQKPFTWDFELVVGEYNDCGLYLRYSPKHQFRSGYGPNFNVWSAGFFIYM